MSFQSIHVTRSRRPWIVLQDDCKHNSRLFSFQDEEKKLFVVRNKRPNIKVPIVAAVSVYADSDKVCLHFTPRPHLWDCTRFFVVVVVVAAAAVSLNVADVASEPAREKEEIESHSLGSL